MPTETDSTTPTTAPCRCAYLRETCGAVKLRSGQPWYCSLICYELRAHVRNCSWCDYVRPLEAVTP